jgi:DNA polymerase bacteriophage-type
MEGIIAVDFESEYSDECNVKSQGNYNYSRATKAFLVALWGGDWSYVGSLTDAPWQRCQGATLVAHNVGFDSEMFIACQEKGEIPEIGVGSWECSADLSAYKLFGRKLAEAAWAAYDIRLPKEIRTRAKNKQWPQDFKPAQQDAFRAYCLRDAELSYRLWTDFQADWPAEERLLARLTRFRAREGVLVDREGIRASHERLLYLRAQAEREIPWAGHYPPLSRAQVAEYCRLQGLEMPSSLASDSVECAAWEAKFGERYPIVGALRTWRKCTIYLRKLEGMLTRVMPNGRMNFDLKYFGADATGRWSGTGGWNMQNLPREAYREVDLRSLLIPAPGHKFVIADFSQIEPRVTAWICGSSILQDLEKGHNLYEADARLAGLWNGANGTLKKTDPSLYQLCKASTLGLAYGMGVQRFAATVKSQLGLEIDVVQGRKITFSWHHRNAGVRRMWLLLERGFTSSLVKGRYSIELPSGRRLHYFGCERKGGKLIASPTLKGLRRKFFWGGSLFENVVQAIARDVLRDAILRLESAGIPVLFSAHDEVVCEVPYDFDAREIEMLMLTRSPWAKGLPLGVELTESQTYLK